MSQGAIPIPSQNRYTDVTLQASEISWLQRGSYTWRGNIDRSTAFGRNDIKNVQVIAYSGFSTPVTAIMDSSNIMLITFAQQPSSGTVSVRGFY